MSTSLLKIPSHFSNLIHNTTIPNPGDHINHHHPLAPDSRLPSARNQFLITVGHHRQLTLQQPLLNLLSPCITPLNIAEPTDTQTRSHPCLPDGQHLPNFNSLAFLVPPARIRAFSAVVYFLWNGRLWSAAFEYLLVRFPYREDLNGS